MKPIPTISIIVCTFNRAEILPYCLDSLVKQTASLDQYEVIIVNNNSSDSTQEIADRYASQYTNFRVVFESRQGLSHARNRGWMEASTEWIAYIDDDAKAYPGYVERIFHIMNNYKFDCFGGIYLPWYKYGKPRWFKDSYAVATNSYVQNFTGPIRKGKYAFGGNIVFKRSVLSELDGFSPEYGMRGTVQAYGEEIHLQKKMEEEGFLIGFDPGLCIDHLVDRYKFSLLWLLRFKFKSSMYYIFVNTPSVSWRSLCDIVRNALSHLIYSTFHASLKLRYNDYCIQNWFLDIFQPLAGYLGFFTGTLKRLLHAR